MGFEMCLCCHEKEKLYVELDNCRIIINLSQNGMTHLIKHEYDSMVFCKYQIETNELATRAL